MLDKFAHAVVGAGEAIGAAGASLLSLLPYSPDLNPIRQLSAKLEALLRKAVSRTGDIPWTTIGHLLVTFSPDECRDHLTNSGHVSE